MKKWSYIFIAFVLIPLLAAIAYYRFRAETEGVFYTIFPIFARVAVDQPIRFNHIHHKEVAKSELYLLSSPCRKESCRRNP